MTGGRVFGAVAASLLLHGLVLAGAAVLLAPRPVPDQPRTQSRIELTSQPVRQTDARAADTGGKPAAEGDATETEAAQGRVSQTIARAREPAASTARLVAAPSVSVAVRQPQVELAATSPRPAPVQAVKPPAVTVAPAVSAAIPLAAARPTPRQIAATVPAAQVQRATQADPAVAVVFSPPQETLPAAATVGMAAKSPAPASPAAMQARLPATTASDLPLPATASIASLAWSGADMTSLTSQSLAAIAAFSTEGDASAEASQVRDEVGALLASVPCARVQSVFDPATGMIDLTGHVPEDALRAPLVAAMRAQMGTAIRVNDNLKILPRPQCAALAGIADAGLPQSDEQFTNPKVIGATGFARDYTYKEGQALRLDVAGPDYDSFVYVDYFAADGTVIHLQPNATVPLERLPAKAAMTVGRPRDGKPYLDLTVGPPFGQEIAAAFATSVPLYDGLRPVTEPAEAYLAFLKDRIAAVRAETADFKGEWVYFFVTTQPD